MFEGAFLYLSVNDITHIILGFLVCFNSVSESYLYIRELAFVDDKLQSHLRQPYQFFIYLLSLHLVYFSFHAEVLDFYLVKIIILAFNEWLMDFAL